MRKNTNESNEDGHRLWATHRLRVSAQDEDAMTVAEQKKEFEWFAA